MAKGKSAEWEDAQDGLPASSAPQRYPASEVPANVEAPESSPSSAVPPSSHTLDTSAPDVPNTVGPDTLPLLELLEQPDPALESSASGLVVPPPTSEAPAEALAPSLEPAGHQEEALVEAAPSETASVSGGMRGPNTHSTPDVLSSISAPGSSILLNSLLENSWHC